MLKKEVIIMDSTLSDFLAIEIVLGFLFFFGFCVVCFFVCRLLLAVAKWFEAKAQLIRHDLALKNYHDDE